MRGGDVAEAGDINRATRIALRPAIGARAAIAADRTRDCSTTGDANELEKLAISAGATNRLRQNAGRAQARPHDIAGASDLNCAGPGAGSAISAKGKRGRTSGGDRQCPADGKTAIAAAATDRLRHDAGRLRATCGDVAA